MSTLHILADENIPLVKDAFGPLGRVRTKPGRAINAYDIANADVLLVRSVTPVGPELLEGHTIRFVGSATIGTDHIDQAYLRERNIAFAHAPASNADSVADYVIAALVRLAVQKRQPLRGRTVGIVGCGNIGGRLVRRLPALGLRVLTNDPPRAEHAEAAGESHDFVPLDRVLAEADCITLHVPLTRDGPHATHHLFDEQTLRRMKSDAWLINTSRGPVVDNAALTRVLADRHLGAAALDVWEDEPTPDPALLRQVDLATPHIAGYAYDGKVRGTVMLYKALCAHLNVEPTWTPDAALAPRSRDELFVPPPDPALPETDWFHHAIRPMYDIAADDRRLRQIIDQPLEERGAYFSRLRKTYPRRREFSRFVVPASAVPAANRTAVTTGLNLRTQRGAEILSGDYAF